MEKSRKFLERCNADLENTLLITDAFVNFLEVHDTKHLKFRVRSL